MKRSEAGYDINKGSLNQLESLLSLPNQEFKEVKETLKSLTLARLDVDIYGQHQEEELCNVVKQLQRCFPAIFETHSKKKIVFVRQLALQIHRQARRNKLGRRRTRGRCVSQVEPTSQQCVAGSADMSCPMGSHSGVSGPRKQKLEPQDGSLTFQDPVTVDKNTENLVPTASASEGATAPCPSATHASGRGISSIHSFLRSCVPSMEHLLYRFVDLGFQSPDTLQTVADKWSRDERRDLLKRLSPSSNGKGVSELELAALEKGFCALRLI